MSLSFIPCLLVSNPEVDAFQVISAYQHKELIWIYKSQTVQNVSNTLGHVYALLLQ